MPPTAPYFARWDETEKGWVPTTEQQASHRFDGATYVPFTREAVRAASASPQTQPGQAQVGPTMTGQGTMNAQDPDQIAAAIRQLVVQQVMPMRQNALLSALGGLTQAYNASPNVLMARNAPQLMQAVAQAQQQRQAVSRQLGPSGGRQINRAQSDITTQLAQTIAQLFGQVPQAAQTQLFNIAQGTGGFLTPGQATSTATGTRTMETPADTQATMQMIAGLAQLGGGIYGAWPTTPTTPFAPTVSPTVPSVGVTPTGVMTDWS